MNAKKLRVIERNVYCASAVLWFSLWVCILGIAEWKLMYAAGIYALICTLACLWEIR